MALPALSLSLSYTHTLSLCLSLSLSHTHAHTLSLSLSHSHTSLTLSLPHSQVAALYNVSFSGASGSLLSVPRPSAVTPKERDFVVENLLVRILLII